MRHLARRLRLARERNAVTVAVMAKDIGVSTRTLLRWLRGDGPRPGTVYAVWVRLWLDRVEKEQKR